MKLKLDTLSTKELEKLKSDVETALTKAETKKRADALKAAEKAASEFGYSLSELLGATPAKSASKTKGAPKYRNPEDPDQTWTGRGRKPNWVISALDAGKSLDDLAI